LVLGRVILANGSIGAGATDGTGGQGLKPLPNMYDGWIQDTVALSGTGQLSAEVEGWIAALTPEQRDPSAGAIALARLTSRDVAVPAPVAPSGVVQPVVCRFWRT
jgi:hypothetical protein